MISSFAHSVYYAPRGKERLLLLGRSLSQSYLHPNDKLIGFIGEAGAGKSVLIRGMFAGLILNNDDDGINVTPSHLIDNFESGKFEYHTYHIDIRFETAFIQPWKLVEAIEAAVGSGKRVVVEHYDLIESQLRITPEMLIGIGEEVLVTRPGVFGPHADEIKSIVFRSIINRKMAHTAEDLTAMAIEKRGYTKPPYHSDIKSGFVLRFEDKPGFSIQEVEEEVKEMIARNLNVRHVDENHIRIGDIKIVCTGPRLHVSHTGAINGFKLLPDFKQVPGTDSSLLVGLVGEERSQFQLSRLEPGSG